MQIMSQLESDMVNLILMSSGVFKGIGMEELIAKNLVENRITG